MRFYFFKIEGEHLLNANWLVQTAINTDRMVYNAIQPTPVGPYRPRSTLIEWSVMPYNPRQLARTDRDQH
jgi:hypothetical protein